MRYPRTSLIRSALGGVRCVATAADSVVTVFPEAQGPSQTSSEGGIRCPCCPASVFCSPRPSCRCRYWSSGSALLRAAHEQFATNPSWHAAPEATFVQQVEPTRPVLAMLRVGTSATEQQALGNISAANIPAIPVPPEQAGTAPPPAEPETIAARKPEPPALPAATKSDMPVPESPAPSQAAAPPSDVPASDVAKIAAAASSSAAQVASIDRAAPEPGSPTANQAVPAATDVEAAASSPASAPASTLVDIAPTKTAMLDSPSITVEAKPPVTAVNAKPDPSVVKKQLRARRAAHRRRMAARAARLARLAAQQQAINPFQQFAQPAAAAPMRSR